ncbi:DUF3784 domain-containing protein [Clostridium beijerinckii]|uniref:DUF3784 domain-containing protein n=2 Tax=Clostridium beijerinckii TaxID=1520 RepID=A0AB74VCD7_CLOBE|nr:DUF3784 domain-containing protein [Clostridium beijerinckii]
MRRWKIMIIGFIMSAIFGLLGMVFLIFKDEACILISGYNLKTKKEREKYDEVRLSKDERNFCFTCSIIYLIGAITSIFLGKLCFWIAFLVWFIYLFKNIHFNPEKAFDKYKK